MFKEIKNICCIHAGYIWGPMTAVFVKNYPSMVLDVVDINQSRIDDWNSDDLSKLSVFETGLVKVIKVWCLGNTNNG